MTNLHDYALDLSLTHEHVSRITHFHDDEGEYAPEFFVVLDRLTDEQRVDLVLLYRIGEGALGPLDPRAAFGGWTQSEIDAERDAIRSEGPPITSANHIIGRFGMPSAVRTAFLALTAPPVRATLV